MPMGSTLYDHQVSAPDVFSWLALNQVYRIRQSTLFSPVHPTNQTTLQLTSSSSALGGWLWKIRSKSRISTETLCPSSHLS